MRFTYEFPRALTQPETDRVNAGLENLFEQFEWERLQPAHVCEQTHGVEVVDDDLISSYSEPPLCHDCGRFLQRPPGTVSNSWICPAIASYPMRANAGGAVECGQKHG
jgi:hypothetical protein